MDETSKSTTALAIAPRIIGFQSTMLRERFIGLLLGESLYRDRSETSENDARVRAGSCSQPSTLVLHHIKTYGFRPTIQAIGQCLTAKPLQITNLRPLVTDKVDVNCRKSGGAISLPNRRSIFSID